MRKIKKKVNVRKIIWPLTGVVCLMVACIQCCVYYHGSIDLCRELTSMQLPALYCVPNEAYLEPETPIVPMDKPEESSFKIELVQTEENPIVDLTGSAPRILIYHTHTTESYFKIDADKYKETTAWRTNDNRYNVVAVGDKLTKALSETYGISVIHDTTNHEPPKLATAYSRSLLTMEKYKEKYPTITMFIDVHRDAYGNNPQGPCDFVTIDGKEVARVMFVVGTGKGATGTGYGEMPDYVSNYALAKRITDTLSAVDSGMIREIRVKSGRYNQHISSQCLLVEVGHNANTINQALNAVDYLAAAIAQAAGIISSPLPLAP